MEAIIDELRFPGYGTSFSGESEQPDGTALELVEVEIPLRNKSRYLVFRSDADGTVAFVDSIVTNWAYNPLVSGKNIRIKLTNSSLVYLHGEETLRTIPIMPHASAQ